MTLNALVPNVIFTLDFDPTSYFYNKESCHIPALFPGRTAGSNKKKLSRLSSPHRRKDNKASGCMVVMETTTQEVVDACAVGFVLMPASHLDRIDGEKEVKVVEAFSLTLYVSSCSYVSSPPSSSQR
ncbi:hypothetical protein HNY73_021977 [Argiope bruennichi]|uniref:Uncharacterized protein n=1 Tax=Argiope bruennichi TaxID=94029 RepID=A0A8T0DZE1_ARGBR|nr:hypothetical protein HNY73_021977 [Argiope bruennichi]